MMWDDNFEIQDRVRSAQSPIIMELKSNLSRQSLAGYEGYANPYDDLPISLGDLYATWHVSDESEYTDITYLEIHHWADFIMRFVREWPDHDWIPTFDVLLEHRVEDATRRYKGNCTLTR